MKLERLFNALHITLPQPPQCCDEIWFFSSLFELEREAFPTYCLGDDKDNK